MFLQEISKNPTKLMMQNCTDEMKRNFHSHFTSIGALVSFSSENQNYYFLWFMFFNSLNRTNQTSSQILALVWKHLKCGKYFFFRIQNNMRGKTNN